MTKRKKKIEPTDKVSTPPKVEPEKMDLSHYFRVQDITWEHIIAGKKSWASRRGVNKNTLKTKEEWDNLFLDY
jgi:hypothetical protein